MKKLLTSLAAGALTAAALGLTAPANAAPGGPSSVDATIDQLRDSRSGHAGSRVRSSR